MWQLVLGRVHVRRVGGVGDRLRVRREGVVVGVLVRGGRVREAVRTHRGTHVVRLVRRRVSLHGRDGRVARRLREVGEGGGAVPGHVLWRNRQLSRAILRHVAPSGTRPALRTLWLPRLAALLMRVSRTRRTPVRRVRAPLLLLAVLLLAAVGHVCDALLRPRSLEKVVKSRGK